MFATPKIANADSQTEIFGGDWIAGAAIEGGIIVARVPSGASVKFDGDSIETDSNGRFILGFHRDSDADPILVITHSDGSKHHTRLTVAQREYKIQRIDGLQREYVLPPEDVRRRIADDNAAVRAARARNDAGTTADAFIAGLDMPVDGRITGVFGSQRILNGQPRAPHYGIDIAAPRGTAVLAPAGGRVTLVRDLYFSGWTVLVAHGMGLNSAFLHLDGVAVQTGDVIGRGTVIGSVGSTGRSTGPHLDWRLDWQGRRLDAALVRRQIADASQQR
ncbi:MAG: peptidase M23 [Rhodospirillaceae bacterium]|nr:peptidase M23 [Rhodospirillaceae bacterium]|tara:strand:- start:671 stop:1498 length:828 start_codon:yes stop_codon:yes gene_type:complete